MVCRLASPCGRGLKLLSSDRRNELQTVFPLSISPTVPSVCLHVRRGVDTRVIYYYAFLAFRLRGTHAKCMFIDPDNTSVALVDEA